MYDATIGRFFSADPIGLDGGDTNLYRYVSNNPTNVVDPSGQGPFTCDILSEAGDDLACSLASFAQQHSGVFNCFVSRYGKGFSGVEKLEQALDQQGWCVTFDEMPVTHSYIDLRGGSLIHIGNCGSQGCPTRASACEQAEWLNAKLTDANVASYRTSIAGRKSCLNLTSEVPAKVAAFIQALAKQTTRQPSPLASTLQSRRQLEAGLANPAGDDQSPWPAYNSAVNRMLACQRGDGGNFPPCDDATVAQMSPAEKLTEAFARSLSYMPAEVADRVRALLTPENAAFFIGFWLAQFVPVLRETVDVTAALFAVFLLGDELCDLQKGLLAFLELVVDAQTCAELDEAAKSFANIAVRLGEKIAVLFVARAANRRKNKRQADGGNPKSNAPNHTVPVSPKTGAPIPTPSTSPIPAQVMADAKTTLAKINSKAAQPWPGKWGSPHKNLEGNLPKTDACGNPITYMEYYLPKSPGESTKWGSNRLVVGSDGTVYVTTTHYGQSGNPPFVYIETK